MFPVTASREMEILNRYKASPPVDVKSAISELGLAYIEVPMQEDQSGYFARHGGTYVIGVNQNDGAQRRRFTAAHELGHYVLHRDMLKEGQHFDRLYGAAAGYNNSGPFAPQHEVQANQFAADFLMPAALVDQTYRNSPSIDSVATRFGVSRRAAEVRLKNLGLIL